MSRAADNRYEMAAAYVLSEIVPDVAYDVDLFTDFVRSRSVWITFAATHSTIFTITRL